MDTIHVILILVVVVVVVLLVSRGRRPGGTFTWTFRIPVGRSPNVERFDVDEPGSQVKEGRASNVGMSEWTQLSDGRLGTVGSNLQAKESLGQRVLEQLLLPKSLLGDVEVQKLFANGTAFLQQGKLDEAIFVFRKAVNLAHHNLYEAHSKPELEGKIAAIAHSNLASGLLAKGEVDAAIVEFREGLRLTPDFASLHDGLGNAFSTKGEQDAAASEFREAARLDPNLAAMHNTLGEALAAKGDLQGATREYRRALNLNPNLAAAQENLRTLLEKKDGRHEVS